MLTDDTERLSISISTLLTIDTAGFRLVPKVSKA
jgi:hypothetical protein